jgi:hypothetical protein
MEHLLSLYQKLNSQFIFDCPKTDSNLIEPNFIILPDGRYQSLVDPWRTYFASELIVLQIPIPHLHLRYHYLSSKDGMNLGYAKKYFNNPKPIKK